MSRNIRSTSGSRKNIRHPSQNGLQSGISLFYRGRLCTRTITRRAMAIPHARSSSLLPLAVCARLQPRIRRWAPLKHLLAFSPQHSYHPLNHHLLRCLYSSRLPRCQCWTPMPWLARSLHHTSAAFICLKIQESRTHRVRLMNKLKSERGEETTRM